LLDQFRFAHRVTDLRVESRFLRPRRRIVLLQFLKAFLDIVLWRRGPQDLPESRLLLGVAVAAYVTVSVVQLALLDEPPATWFVFVVLDPLLLAGWVFGLLRLFGREARFVQTAAAVFGTGALLGLGLFLPVQFLVTSSGVAPESVTAGIAALGLVVVFALVTGRILQSALETGLFAGMALAFAYFLMINSLLGLVGAGGGD
jgi:hypothetical protein